MLSIPAGDNTLRLLPPLTITDAELDEAVQRLDRACVRTEAALAKAAA
jgi:acetylornithine/N-succinyldiaminopimelate aminotransferase